VPLFDGLLNYRTKPDGRPLTDDEIADESTCAFIANTETPGKVAAQGLLELSRRPGQLAQLREDLPKNVPIATEEMLRLPRLQQPAGDGQRVARGRLPAEGLGIRLLELALPPAAVPLVLALR
jgi:cytochrome P450